MCLYAVKHQADHINYAIVIKLCQGCVIVKALLKISDNAMFKKIIEKLYISLCNFIATTWFLLLV